MSSRDSDSGKPNSQDAIPVSSDALERTVEFHGARVETQKRFGRYEIVKQLGRGGMGAVLLAKDTKLDRLVALKIPQLNGKRDADVIERFMREAKAAATLEHPNLCSVYDVGEIDGRHFLTMAYIKGRPLSDYIRSGKRFSLHRIASLIRKVSLALDQAHSAGVVHRDLKPANIMMNEKRQPIVVDFGLARRLEQATELTREGVAVGTPAYMSPEQIRAEPLGPATDIYSLGTVLYELMTGRTPFRGDALSVTAQILSVEPPPPSAVRDDVDSRLETICLQAMAKSSKNRQPSMATLANQLKDYLQGDDIRHVPTSAADLFGDDLPELAPLETQVGQATLAPQARKTFVAKAIGGPPKISAEDKKQRETLTIALAVVAILFGGYRCLTSLSVVLMALLNFSFAGLILMSWVLMIGGLAGYLAFLGLRVLQREEGALERASQVATVFLAMAILGLVGSVFVSIGSLMPTQNTATQVPEIEIPESMKDQYPAEQLVEQIRRESDTQLRSREASLAVGLWLLQLAEFLPVGFILWANMRIQQLSGNPNAQRANKSANKKGQATY